MRTLQLFPIHPSRINWLIWLPLPPVTTAGTLSRIWPGGCCRSSSEGWMLVLLILNLLLVCLCLSAVVVRPPPPAWWPAATSPTRRTPARWTLGSSSATSTPCWSPRQMSRPSSPNTARSLAAPSTRGTPSSSTPTRGTPALLSMERTAGWLWDKYLVR